MLLLTGGASFFHYRSQYQRTILEELNSLAQLIGSNCDSAIVFDDPLAAAQVLASLKAKPEIVTAVIHGRSGAVFARYTRPGFTSDEIRGVPTENSHLFGPKYLELYHRVLLNNELIGTVYISHDLSRMQERFRGVLLLTALMVLLALCLALLLSSYFQRVVTDPLLHLTGVAESISREKDYSVRVDNPCFDEVGDLINTFNEMVAEIQKRDGFLEEQVQQRTGDLQQAIDVLKQEMDERKKAEQKISASLKEKDVLLK
ncbi:MAG: HAMP domain-containing protein, partial [Deltaproteobacteria bacterium]|nr:HAMP domain-containing protein [Deltaproteobacteria bacterium]